MSRALTMPPGLGRAASRALTHAGLVVSRPRGRTRWLWRAALAGLVLATGIGVGHVLRDSIAPPQQPSAAAAAETAALRQQLEQARLGLRLSDARGQELERQIDGLNQKLAASQDELTFYRKAREGKH